MGGITSEQAPDAILTAYIAAADALIDEYSRHDWNEHAGELEYQDGTAREKLILRNYPVIAINSIKKRTGDGSQDTLTVYDPLTNDGDYLLHKAGAGIIRFVNGHQPSEGVQNIEIDYDWGYATVPQHVQDLAAMMAAVMGYGYAAGVASPEGLVSISEGALSLSWGGGPYAQQITDLKVQIQTTLTLIGRRILYGSAEIE